MDTIDVTGLTTALKEMRASTLTTGICETVANEPDAKHAVRLVLSSLTGALMKKGEMDLAEKVVDFLTEL